MRRRVLVAAALLCGAQWSVTACHRGTRSRASTRARNSAADRATLAATVDSLVGVVSVTGTSFERHLMLRGGHGTRPDATTLTAAPTDSIAISRLGGVEILVRGRREGSVFRVATFEALRVDGAPVTDGVLVRDGTRLALWGARGRITLGNPPAAFLRMIGARVWVSGPLDTGPNAYGVIVPPPTGAPMNGNH